MKLLRFLNILRARRIVKSGGYLAPSRHANVTFKKAPRAADNQGTAQELPFSYDTAEE